MLAEHQAHVFEAKAEAVQLCRINIDAHCGKRTAADVDLADTLNLQQPLLNDGGGRIVELPAVMHVRRERQDHDWRVGGVDFAVGWIVRQIGGQIGAGGIDGRLHVARRPVDAAAQVKLQGDAGGAEIAGGGHFSHTGDVAELAFQWSGHR